MPQGPGGGVGMTMPPTGQPGGGGTGGGMPQPQQQQQQQNGAEVIVTARFQTNSPPNGGVCVVSPDEGTRGSSRVEDKSLHVAYNPIAAVLWCLVPQ